MRALAPQIFYMHTGIALLGCALMTGVTQLNRRNVLRTIGTAGIVGIAGCSSGGGGGSGGESDGGESGADSGGSGGSDTESSSGGTSGDTVKAAVVQENTETSQWVRAHLEAINAVADEFDWLEVSTSLDIAAADAEQTFRNYADQGADIIFGNAFAFMDPLLKVSKDYPDVAFENAGGVKTGDNMGLYTIKAHEGYYLAGIAAGMLSESKTLGFVAPFPVAKILRRINTLTIGARTVDPEITTKVNWVGTWFDPSKEAQAAQSLIDQGADVVTNWTNSVAVPKRANSNDTWVIASATDQSDSAGDNYVTSVMANWAAHHREDLKQVKNGEWSAEFEWHGISEGYVELDDWGPQVPSDVGDKVGSAREKLVAGDVNVWEGTAFEGKSEDYMFGKVSEYVEGVEGKVPQ